MYGHNHLRIYIRLKDAGMVSVENGARINRGVLNEYLSVRQVKDVSLKGPSLTVDEIRNTRAS